MTDLALAWFFNDGTNARVYFAQLPDPESQHLEMRFKGPRKLDVPDNAKLLYQHHAVPVYHDQKEEITWATHGQYAPGKHVGCIDIWRIGKHFSVDGISRAGSITVTPGGERFGTGLALTEDYERPSLILEDNLISASIPAWNSEGEAPVISLVQRIDSKWQSIVHQPRNVDGAYYCDGSRIFSYSGSSPAGGLKYVYNVSRSKDNNDCLYVDIMSASNFTNLSKDLSLWQKHDVKTSLGKGDMPAHVFTHGKNNHNLIFMAFSHTHDNILRWAMVPLRRDGSIDLDRTKSYDGDAIEPFEGSIALPFGQDESIRNLCAFEYQGHLLLLWTGDIENHGMIGKLDGEGQIPNDCEWRPAPLKFDKPIAWLVKKYDITGVVVPNEFW